MTSQTISVVVPVYRGETTLPALLAEIAPYAAGFETAGGAQARITEVVLVNDCGPDNSAQVIRELARQYDFVQPVWLSRNFGQHQATMAGMAASSGEWIATIDEDGQYDPGQIRALLDVALATKRPLVYAAPVNAAPHGPFRNLASKASKRVIDLMTGSKSARNYHSFRLVLGSVGREVASIAGATTFLDVALGWIAGDAATAPVRLRDEGRESGYSLPRLLSHFWSMVLTSGTRGLRAASITGFLLALAGLLGAVAVVVQRFRIGVWPAGWASLMVVTLTLGGIMLLFLGVVAEYVGVAVNSALGKPAYFTIEDPSNGPLA